MADNSAFYAKLESLKDIDPKAVIEGAKVLLLRAQEIVPVDTGELRDSGKVTETEDGAWVEFTADHAIFIEFGTSVMQPQPYLRPAMDMAEKEILEAIGEDVRMQIEAKL